MMKRTNVIFGRRSAALAVAGMMALLGFSATAKAVLVDPNVFLSYSTLDFVFMRNATAATSGAVVGTFSLHDIGGSGLVALLQNGMGAEVDRATILNATNFNVALTGDVIFQGANSYTLESGSLLATDNGASTDKIDADFVSTEVSLSGGEFVVRGDLSRTGGILVNGVSSTEWSFFGHPPDNFLTGAPDPGDDGVNDRITLSGNVASYDTGSIFELKIGSGFADLDALFIPGGSSGDTATLGGGTLEVTIIPAPPALVLGMIGLATVGWFRRRLS